MRHRQMYDRVVAKRDYHLQHGEVSVPSDSAAKVAVLVSFMPELVQNSKDSRRHFEKQTERVEALFRANGQAAQLFMRATVEDYKIALTDRQYASMVIAGFGNISAIAVPFDRDPHSTRFGYIDWLHAAAIADHVKLGKMIMLQCNGFNRTFNPPWGVGVMSSHQNIIGDVGRARYASSDLPITPVTDQEVLSYDQILAQYQPENYQPPGDVDVEMGRMRRAAYYLADMGILSAAGLERLRSISHMLDPGIMFSRTYPATPEPIKIPYVGEFDPRTFPQA